LRTKAEQGALEFYAKELIINAVGGLDTFEDSEHFEGTPNRFIKMLDELTTPEDFTFTMFDSSHDEMITVSPIPFYSLCAHHMIPFFGEAHVAYVPQGKIAGLSKIARTVKYFSHNLWVQEDLTWTIAEHLEERLEPLGVAVIMKGEHLCMTMRGVQSPGTKTTTSIMRGVFIDPKKQAREEFLRIIGDDL
jgi:GTP cyclohydrolase IA